MLILKDYKLNRNGNIHKEERVQIQCDRCGSIWTASYKSRKKKVLNEDLCRRCIGKKNYSELAVKPWSIARQDVRIDMQCDNCRCNIKKIPSRIKQHNFCCLKCRDEYLFHIKYKNIEKSFKDHPDEVAYLIGLILGDGTIRRSGEKTVRVGIAFDYTGKWAFLIEECEKVLDILSINWYKEPKSHNGCKMIGFAIPIELMEKYNLYYYGDKFKNQPFPSEDICKNINYAVGLINSDGYARLNYFVFSNTVRSISDSFSKCLSYNRIKHSTKYKNGRIDERTGNAGKDIILTYITSQIETMKLISKSKFKIKSKE